MALKTVIEADVVATKAYTYDSFADGKTGEMIPGGWKRLVWVVQDFGSGCEELRVAKDDPNGGAIMAALSAPGRFALTVEKNIISGVPRRVDAA